MKNWKAIERVTVTISYPKEWGELEEMFQDSSKHSKLYDEIYGQWVLLIENNKVFKDVTSGFQMFDVTFEIIGPFTPAQLDRRIDQAKNMLHKAYKNAMKIKKEFDKKLDTTH